MNKNIIAFCFALICFSAQLSFGQSFGKLLKETPGMVSYTFREAFAKDVPGTLDKIKALGVTNMEFSNFFGVTPENLRSMLDQRGMRCTSLGVGYGDLLNKPETVIKNAKILGAEFVRVASIPHPGSFENLDAATVKKAAVDFDIFGKKLNENGLKFCYHNHGPEFLPAGELMPNATFFDYLVQKTNPEYVFFEMDVLWVYYPGQDPVALLKKYPNRFKLMHLKDLKKGISRDPSGKGTSGENNVPVGSGQIDMQALIKESVKSGVRYLYIEDESSIPDQQVPLSLLYMKGL